MRAGDPGLYPRGSEWTIFPARNQGARSKEGDIPVTLVPSHSHWGAFLAEVEGGRVTGVRPFAKDPDPSPLIGSIPAMVHSPVRIARPMVRKGWLEHGPGGGGGRGREPFVAVEWDTALGLVARELQRVYEAHGPGGILGGSQGWASAGLFHNARAQLHRFLSSCGGFVDQATNYSFGAAQAFLPHILGTGQAVSGPLTSWSSIARHAGLMVMFGGANLKNLQVAKGGCAAHATTGWIAELGRAGVRVVNVSPVRADGPASAAAEWLPIRPNTDTAMLLALTTTVIEAGRADRDFLARYCTGFGRVEPYLMGAEDGQKKDAAWAASITGVAAETIRSLALALADQRSMITASWSLQRADHGEQPYWAVILLASVLGQIGLPGGGFGFGYGSASGIAEPPLAVKTPALPGLRNPAALAIPAARIVDCLLAPGEEYDFNGRRARFPDLRLVYWAGGNPFHHHQDLNRLRSAWAKPETIIVHEPWWTATARHADIVLPATTALERNDLGSAPRDPFIIAMQRAIPPVGEARDDFTIFRDLARKLGHEERYTEGRDEMGWVRHLYDGFREAAQTNQASLPDFESFWREGWVELPRKAEEYVMFQDFRADPDAHKLHTGSGRIELFSEKIESFGYADCPPHASWIEPAEWLGGEAAGLYPLHLVSSQPQQRLHSQMDPGPVSAAAKIGGREPVLINPYDAAERGITDGAVVRLFNARGACLAGAVISDGVRQGVVQLSCGAWYDPTDAEGRLCAHGNANMLTRDAGTSRLGQGPSSATALVEIERWSEALPPLTIFAPPVGA
jgi:biotin/methionine sulfoxide reductase